MDQTSHELGPVRRIADLTDRILNSFKWIQENGMHHVRDAVESFQARLQRCVAEDGRQFGLYHT